MSDLGDDVTFFLTQTKQTSSNETQHELLGNLSTKLS